MMSMRQIAFKSSSNALLQQSIRSLSSTTGLFHILANKIPKKREEIQQLRSKYKDISLGNVTVDQCIGGARGVKCILWETSTLDPNVGIKFRGYTIPEIQEKLPKSRQIAKEKKYKAPIPEGLLWLLLTDEIPTEEQAYSLTAEFHKRAQLPNHIVEMINNFPNHMHPMAQLSTCVLAMNTESLFAKEYEKGMHRSKHWEFIYEDILNLLAKLPEVAARIYRRTFFHEERLPAKYNASLDYSSNFCRMLGYNNEEFDELMRLYLCIHSDHEGGNASAHTTRLVSSTLSDPYFSYSAGLASLAGPLHGLANQEVLNWLQQLQQYFIVNNLEVNEKNVSDYAWKTLKEGKVIPGYGHAVLRITDPRYFCQREFALNYMPNDELFRIVNVVYEVMPKVLTEHGKVKNPYPNVDSHSGCLLYHYGFTQKEFYTALFGVSRAFGCLSQLLWDRALNLPIERPKSVTPTWIKEYCEKQGKN